MPSRVADTIELRLGGMNPSGASKAQCVADPFCNRHPFASSRFLELAVFFVVQEDL